MKEGGQFRRSDDVHALHDVFNKFQTGRTYTALLRQVSTSWSLLRTMDAREVADSSDSLVCRWGMLATIWRGDGVLLGHSIFGARRVSGSNFVLCIQHFGDLCASVHKKQGSIAAGCRSSLVSAACHFVPGVNLVFSCFMDRMAKSGKRALYADGARLWKRMASGLGITCHQVSHQRKQGVAETSRPQPRSSQGLE